MIAAILRAVLEWRVRRLAMRIYLTRVAQCGYGDASYALHAAHEILGWTEPEVR